MTSRTSCAGSTWKYLSEGRQQQPVIPYVSVRDRIRRSSAIVEKENVIFMNQMQNMQFSQSLGKNAYSEIELHTIKIGFVAIDSLWRDISMGSEQISESLFSMIHKELGEIGSELFRRIFLGKALPNQATKFRFF